MRKQYTIYYGSWFYVDFSWMYYCGRKLLFPIGDIRINQKWFYLKYFSKTQRNRYSKLWADLVNSWNPCIHSLQQNTCLCEWTGGTCGATLNVCPLAGVTEVWRCNSCRWLSRTLSSSRNKKGDPEEVIMLFTFRAERLPRGPSAHFTF